MCIGDDRWVNYERWVNCERRVQCQRLFEDGSFFANCAKRQPVSHNMFDVTNESKLSQQNL